MKKWKTTNSALPHKDREVYLFHSFISSIRVLDVTSKEVFGLDGPYQMTSQYLKLNLWLKIYLNLTYNWLLEPGSVLKGSPRVKYW